MSRPGLQAVRVVGGLVPPGLFAKVRAGELRDTASLSSESYHLVGRETPRDAANRSWTYLRGAWTTWRDHATRQGTGAGTGAARDQWLLVLMRELGYGQLPALRGGIGIDGVDYPVSHAWQHVPVHLLGPGVELDRRNPGVAGAARAPQAMIQELLNRSKDHLWAVLSNGLRLRLLRDSTALAGSAYVEFDLEAVFDSELFSEFLLLWQLCHVSRLEKRGGTDAPPSDCWLEAWHNDAVDSGARALNQLRDGVEHALQALGTGYLRHPANDWLCAALRTNELSTVDYHRALLRMVYRLLFLSVVEAREVLLNPEASREATENYTRFFSIGRLHSLSRLRSGGPHSDLWESLLVVLGALGGDGLKQLGLPVLAGLFDPADRRLDDGPGKTDHLLGCSLANADLLSAMRALGWVAIRGQRIQPVDYRNLGAEELGSVYESLLELVPRVDLDDRTFRMELLAGNERKTSGTYFTPSTLVNALLDSTLDPLLDEAVKNARDATDAVRRLLKLTVCDPACGSGHFLVAAARRIARRIAQQRSGEDEPTPEEVQHALHEVVGRCLYGVDVNPMAAELTKVTLWMETQEPGKPLSFLDATIRIGDSLLGATPTMIAAGVPDGAFTAIEGDEKTVATAWRRQNRKERNQLTFVEFTLSPSNTGLSRKRQALREADDDVRGQGHRFALYNTTDDDLQLQRQQADARCAAFVWNLVKDGIDPPTSGVVRGFVTAPDKVDPAIRSEALRIADEYQFFHWHLEFPEIFGVSGEADPDAGSDGWTGGFDCLLGNVPWERVKLQEQEFFAARDPEIAGAANKAERGRRIKALLTSTSPGAKALHQAYLDAKRHAEGESVLLRFSGRFPLTGRGDVNTYAVFAETFRALTGPCGRSGIIVPTGIATDATTQYFFRDLVESGTLAALYDFENAAPIFEGVHRSFKFSLMTLAGRETPEPAAHFAFFLHDAALIESASFSMTPEEITLLNPNTGTCPVFRTRRDAEITLDIYKRIPVFVKEGDTSGNPWKLDYLTKLFDMADDSDMFTASEDLESDTRRKADDDFAQMVPLFEAKMIHHFDDRWSSFERDKFRDVSEDSKGDQYLNSTPKYWIPLAELNRRLSRRWPHGWLLGFRDICRSTDERTLIVCELPRIAVAHTIRLLFPWADGAQGTVAACLSAFIVDYIARQKLGGTHLTMMTLLQLPIIAPSRAQSTCHWDPSVSNHSWITNRTAELNYTHYPRYRRVEELRSIDSPFRWNAERRSLLRAELDAAFFHLYGVKRDDVDYILESFPIVKRKDTAKFGDYRTKRLILDVYDRMTEAITLRESYQTILDPPPGQGARHPAKASAKK